MIFRRYVRFLSILCVALYIPVLLGSGECVALCLKSDGSFILDYTHRCGIADYSSLPKDAAAKKVTFSAAFFSEPIDSDGCRDIPLSVGNHFHFVPEINHQLFFGLTSIEFSDCRDDFPIQLILNSTNNYSACFLLYPPSDSKCNYSILII
jgi:hypothetical protein